MRQRVVSKPKGAWGVEIKGAGPALTDLLGGQLGIQLE